MQQAKPDDIRVADYVLGLMDAREAALFERDMRARPDLAELVEGWRQRVSEADRTVLLSPHEQMRRRIETGLTRHAERVKVENRRRMTDEFRKWLTTVSLSFVIGVAVGAACIWVVLR